MRTACALAWPGAGVAIGVAGTFGLQAGALLPGRERRAGSNAPTRGGDDPGRRARPGAPQGLFIPRSSNPKAPCRQAGRQVCSI